MPAPTTTTTQQVSGLIGLPSTPGIVEVPSFGGSDDADVVDSDFCMGRASSSPCCAPCTQKGSNSDTIHQHMRHEQPRCLFLPYWGKAKAVDLAQSLQHVRDARAAVKS